MPVAGKVVTWRKERLAHTNLLRAGRAGAPARALAAFCQLQKGLADPSCLQPSLPTTQPP